jgi:hypothetical protein
VAFGMYVTCHCHDNSNSKGATTMTATKINAGFQTLALSSIHESTTNPRRTFDEAKLAELVPLPVLWPWQRNVALQKAVRVLRGT